jgi:hypothetical protein
MLKKSVLLKGTASAVPQVLFFCSAALAAEVRFLFERPLFQHPLQPPGYALLSQAANRSQADACQYPKLALEQTNTATSTTYQTNKSGVLDPPIELQLKLEINPRLQRRKPEQPFAFKHLTKTK